MKFRNLSFVILASLFISFRAVYAAPVSQVDPGKVAGDVLQAVQQNGTVSIIVTLADSVSPVSSLEARESSVAQTQSAVLAVVGRPDFVVYDQYSHIPALVGVANTAAINTLAANPQVVAVNLNERIEGHTTDSVPALGANTVHSTMGLTGQGVRVAVLDSGIDTDHPALSDSIIAQHCFNQGGTFGDAVGDCPPGDTLESTSAEDQNGHGTNVSGIITSNGAVGGVGFAPDAQIIAVRVLDTNNSGWVSDWLAGLNWIIANQGTLQVDIINMSLGTNALHTSNCDASYLSVANAITQLRNMGITIFASSGNQGSSTSISAPACNSNVMAVGATYDINLGREPDSGTYNSLFGGSWPACADLATNLQTVTCFTNSNALIDIVAPGAQITSAYIGGGLGTYRGTSQASPTAAGIAALMLDFDPTLSPAEIENALKTTGTLVTDPKNNRQFPLINALAALTAITASEPGAAPNRNYFTTDTPTLTWTRIASAQSYVIEIANNIGFMGASATTVNSTIPSYTVPALEDGFYYWRVAACTGINGVGCGSYSFADTFTIDT